MSAEVLTAGGAWLRLEPGAPPPRVEESRLFALRNLPPRSTVRIGSVEEVADAGGRVGIPLRHHDDLRGHIGLIPIDIDDTRAGEIEVVPDKMSESAYAVLRADLERTWAGLIHRTNALSSLSARLPSAESIAERIEQPLRSIEDSPSERLVRSVGPIRATAVRRHNGLNSAAFARIAVGLPAVSTSVARTTDTPEQAMVATTLRRLHRYALLEGDLATEARVRFHLRNPLFASQRDRLATVTWAMKADTRYRQLLDVHRMLDQPELHAVEGPGALRWGVKGLSRLYEYWVFLKVLEAAEALYGPALGDGIVGALAASASYRGDLDIEPGTSVSFPGDCHVVFEPQLFEHRPGWMGLTYVPHPDPQRAQTRATPDVVVLRAGNHPSAVVFDAKYVGRGMIERDAARLHEKYSRMTINGRPVVRHVIAVHPHRDRSNHWAGYGHLALDPGHTNRQLPLPVPIHHLARPASSHAQPPTASTAGPVSFPTAGSEPPSRDEPRATAEPTGEVAVILDQRWLVDQVSASGRRYDLTRAAELLAGGRSVGARVVVMPRLALLEGFRRVLERQGWTIDDGVTVARGTSLRRLIDLAAEWSKTHAVVVLSGDDELRALARERGVDVEFETTCDRLPRIR